MRQAPQIVPPKIPVTDVRLTTEMFCGPTGAEAATVMVPVICIGVTEFTVIVTPVPAVSTIGAVNPRPMIENEPTELRLRVPPEKFVTTGVSVARR